MSDEKPQEADEGIVGQSVSTAGLCHTELVERLRNTPNWKREEFRGWKENCAVFDRAPFEAADEIERLRAEMDALFDAIRAVYKDVGTPGDYGYGTKTGKALAYLYSTNNAVDNHNLGECGRLAREYARHNLNSTTPPVG